MLSVHDGSRYPLDVTELGLLDTKAFEYALDVIRLRALNGREPHECLDDGEAVMARLVARLGRG